VTASSLCGACGEVCPVKIPIPDILIQLRRQSQGTAEGLQLPAAGSGRKVFQPLAFKLWAWMYSSPLVYRSFAFLATVLRGLTPPRQGAWTRSRAPLTPAKTSLHEQMRRRNAERKKLR
jgi:L-lactate dehydrogenase complex protein LldF